MLLDVLWFFHITSCLIDLPSLWRLVRISYSQMSACCKAPNIMLLTAEHGVKYLTINRKVKVFVKIN